MKKTKAKYQQGEYEYYAWKRKSQILKTTIWLVIFAALLLTGYLITKTTSNFFTAFALVILVPVSKNCVSMFMYLRYHGCSEENYRLLCEPLSGFLHAYGLVFSSELKTYEVAGCIVKNGYIYGYLTNHPDSHKDLEQYLCEMLKENGCKATIAMYTDPQDFISRCAQIKQKESENRKSDEKLMELLYQRSL